MTEDMIHNRSTIALFEKLGLSKTEVKCYLATLTLSSAKISDIAKTADINRVNAYGAIKNLADRGLVEQEMTGKGRRVYSAPLEHLQTLAWDYQNQAARCRWKIENLIPSLAAITSGREKAPSSVVGDVLFFRGEDAFYKIADRTLNIPRGSKIYFIDPFASDKKSYLFQPPDNPGYDETYYIPERLRRKISAKVLFRKTQYGEQRLKKNDQKELRETRFLSADISFPCSIIVYHNEVAFLWKKEWIVGVVIRDNPVVDLMKYIFEMIWQMTGTKE